MIKNLTAGPPTRLIVLFALPLLIGNVFQQLYAFTDAAVVGRMLGVDALASVGAAGSLQFLLLGFTFGASGGMAIPVARAFGAGDMPAMRRYVAAGVMIAGGIAVTVTAVGVFLSRPLLQLLDTPHALIGNSTVFLAITFSGASVTMAYNFLAATIRALGDSRTPLIFLIIACVLNAGLVVLFIGAFHLGVGGAALATVVAQAVSVLACLALIVRRMPALRLRRADFQLRDGEFGEVARMGLTMGFQMSVIAVGTLVLQYAINGLGTEGVAAATAAMRVDQFATQPMASFGLAMATFVAQNRGAGEWLRIRTGVFRITLVTWGVAVLLGVGVILGGTPLVRLFIGDGEDHVVALAHQYLVISGSLYVILASLFVLRNTLQGLGSTSVPTIAGAMELVLRAAAGLVLVAHFGFIGVCLAGPLAWLGALTPMLVAWYRKRRELIAGHLADDRLDERELPALATA